MRPHVGAETLAGFHQGDLNPRRSARVRAHLAACGRCSELNEDLAGVTTLLARVHPPPMPEDLTTRIHTALAAEASKRAPLPAGTEAMTRTTAGTALRLDVPHQRAGGSGGPSRPPGLRSAIALRTVAAAAAVILVAGGTYEIVRHSASPSPPAGSPSHSAARRPGPSTAVGPALRYRHAGRQESIAPIATGTDYTAGKLSSQVSTEVARPGSGTRKAVPNAVTPPADRGPVAGPAQRSATFGSMPVSALGGCVNRMAAGGLVLLVDVAQYQGTPATVIVTEVSAAGPEQIWVVGTGCSGSRSDVLKHAVLAAAG